MKLLQQPYQGGTKSMWRTTVISALTLLALALAALFEASKLPFGRLSAPQPGFFPVILAVLLAIFSLVLIAQAIGETKEESVASPAAHATWKGIVLALGALVVYGVLFESLGYVISTFLFIAFLMRAVDRQRWGLIAVVAFSTSLISYLLFGFLLETPLPQGILCF